MNEKIKIKENKDLAYFASETPKIKMKYPHIKDQSLQSKIFSKQEFQYKYDGEIKDIVEEDKNGNLCSSKSFELNPHQQFVKRFMSHHTPYNGLLLYHGMGSGKTCSAIGITEEFRKYNKYNENYKKVYIIASPNVQENFKLQLFDRTKLKRVNNMWNLEGCVGESLLMEMKNYNLEKVSEESIVRKISRIINKNYEFLGYGQFANMIENIHTFEATNEKSKKKIIKTRLNNLFDGAMLVIDEAHNIRLSGDKEDKKVASSLIQCVNYVKKMKLLLLTGTPMYNDHREILLLLNILNINDGYTPVSVREIFDKNGNFLKDKDGNEIGKARFMEKANGYISYVRGENPYNFPFKVYPNIYESPFSSKSSSYVYPKQQFNNKQIEESIQTLDLYLNELSSYQSQGYQSIMMRKFSELMEGDIEKFENMSSFGYTLLQEPLNSLNIVYQLQEGSDSTYVTGKQVLQNVMTHEVQDRAPMKKYDYEYIIPEKIFQYNNIGKFSAKIKTILDCVMNSTGIVLIYSQYLESGLIPIALCLEELGFDRCKQNNLLKPRKGDEQIKKLNVKTMNYNQEGSFKQAKYAMITGDKYYSNNNKQELQISNLVENTHGDYCKVVLISQAGSEGLDFKNLRQVHVLEPWYNLNRIDQVIGRAVRNCSHRSLPLNERNVQIYLHATPEQEGREALDMMIYRYAEKKSIKIGMIQKLLKEISVDCLLNEEQNNFATMMQQKIDIRLSDGNTINYSLADKPFSTLCDYSESCVYTCANKEAVQGNVNADTMHFDFVINEQVVQKVKHLFLRNHVYDLETIYDSLLSKNTKKENIEFALNYLVDEKVECVDKYMRKGHIIQVKDLYIFRPKEFDGSTGLIYDFMHPLSKKVSKIKVNGENLIPKKKIQSNIRRNQPSENAPYTSASALPSATNVPISQSPKMSFNEGSAKVSLNGFTIKRSRDLDAVIQKINLMYNIGMNSASQEMPQDEKYDFYKNYDSVFERATQIFDIPELKSNKEKFLITHIVDSLHLKEEKLLMDYLFKNKSNLSPLESKIFQLVENFVVEENGVKILVLVDVEKQVLHRYTMKFVESEFMEWKPITSTEFQRFGESNWEKWLSSQKPDHAQYVVFSSYYKNTKTNELKIREPSKGKKNKGAFFFQKYPSHMIPIFHSIYGKNLFVSKKKRTMLIKDESQTFSSGELVMMFELLCKSLTENPSNPNYYLSKLQSVVI